MAFEFSDSTRTEENDYFNGWRLTIVQGTGKGGSGIVTDYVASTGTFVFDATTAEEFTSTPDTTSVYAVEPPNNLHPAGAKFDRAIESSCLAKAEQFFENINAGHVEEYVQKDLPKAYQADGRSSLHVVIKANKPPRERYFKPVTHS